MFEWRCSGCSAFIRLYCCEITGWSLTSDLCFMKIHEGCQKLQGLWQIHGMKSNSCLSVDINAIVCSTYKAATTYLTLYSLLFQSAMVCMFPDIGNHVYEYRTQCVSHLCKFTLMQFKWIYCLHVIKISQQSISVMKSMRVTVMLVAQRTVKGRCKALLHSILTKQGILINKNWI